jgi:hypothetical protein
MVKKWDKKNKREGGKNGDRGIWEEDKKERRG